MLASGPSQSRYSLAVAHRRRRRHARLANPSYRPPPVQRPSRLRWPRRAVRLCHRATNGFKRQSSQRQPQPHDNPKPHTRLESETAQQQAAGEALGETEHGGAPELKGDPSPPSPPSSVAALPAPPTSLRRFRRSLAHCATHRTFAPMSSRLSERLAPSRMPSADAARRGAWQAIALGDQMRAIPAPRRASGGTSGGSSGGYGRRADARRRA